MCSMIYNWGSPVGVTGDTGLVPCVATLTYTYCNVVTKTKMQAKTILQRFYSY